MAATTEETPAVEGTASTPPPPRSRGFWFLGEDKSVHMALGGGKTADVLLWKDKKTSAAVVGGATVLWFLFEIVEYHLLTLVSHLLIAALTILFLWWNATVFIKKSPPDVPEVQIPEDLAVNIALALRADINKALVMLREIALGHNLIKFIGVIVALWILSEIGELCGLLRLMYIGGLDPPYSADILPQVSGPGGRFRCKSTQRALQAVQGPGRQSSEQDSKSSNKR